MMSSMYTDARKPRRRRCSISGASSFVASRGAAANGRAGASAGASDPSRLCSAAAGQAGRIVGVRCGPADRPAGHAPQRRKPSSRCLLAVRKDQRSRATVRLDEMEEHMRISLLDPKWKEQKYTTATRRSWDLKRHCATRSDGPRLVALRTG